MQCLQGLAQPAAVLRPTKGQRAGDGFARTCAEGEQQNVVGQRFAIGADDVVGFGVDGGEHGQSQIEAEIGRDARQREPLR